MKAEHRRELQTNALADRMGRVVQRIKAPPDRRSLLWIIAAVAVVIGTLIVILYYNNKRATNSHLWTEVEENSAIKPLRKGGFELSESLRENPTIGEW